MHITHKYSINKPLAHYELINFMVVINEFELSGNTGQLRKSLQENRGRQEWGK